MYMDRLSVERWITEHFAGHSGNVVTAEMAAEHPQVAGLVMYDAPLMGVAAADDPLFERYKSWDVIAPFHMTPCEWLPGAKSVISLFFPLSQRVRASNRGAIDETSYEWLYARIEGQAFIAAFCAELAQWLKSCGARVCVPAADPRFGVARGGEGPLASYPGAPKDLFASNWSERHAAFAAGLGTFSLTRGLITKRGMAGRFGSVIVDLPLEVSPRPYREPYEYCIRCGACARRCPAGAISLERGKEQAPCKAYLGRQKQLYAPRYGCGKCQTAVPCEAGIPIAPRA